METLVLRACINGLIKILCFLDYWGPGEISWFLRLPGKVPDVGCCNQPLPETQSLQEEAVSKYHKCVLKPQKAVQPSWKLMFTRRNDERVCTIYRGINVSWLWTWTASKAMKVLQHHQESLKVWRVKSWVLWLAKQTLYAVWKEKIRFYSFSRCLFFFLTSLSLRYFGAVLWIVHLSC